MSVFPYQLGKFTGLKAAVILGGDKMDDQFAALHDKPDMWVHFCLTYLMPLGIKYVFVPPIFDSK